MVILVTIVKHDSFLSIKGFIYTFSISHYSYPLVLENASKLNGLLKATQLVVVNLRFKIRAALLQSPFSYNWAMLFKKLNRPR